MTDVADGQTPMPDSRFREIHNRLASPSYLQVAYGGSDGLPSGASWDLYREAERARQAEKQLRARLDEIGEVHDEWGVRIFDHDPANATEVMSDKAMALEVAACWREEIEGSNPTLMQRTMRSEGQWREADDDD